MSDTVIVQGNRKGRISECPITKLQHAILTDMVNNKTNFMAAYRNHSTGSKAMEMLWRLVWDGKVDLSIPAHVIDELEGLNGI